MQEDSFRAVSRNIVMETEVCYHSLVICSDYLISESVFENISVIIWIYTPHPISLIFDTYGRHCFVFDTPEEMLFLWKKKSLNSNDFQLTIFWVTDMRKPDTDEYTGFTISSLGVCIISKGVLHLTFLEFIQKICCVDLWISVRPEIRAGWRP